MEKLLSLLGFTDLFSTAWNLFAYIGMTAITIAVISVRWRNQFFFWGPLMLMLYALFYLNDPILVGLQIIVTVSGFLNLADVKKRAPQAVITLTIVVYAGLLVTGQISGIWQWVGSFGLLGIALGLTQLPHRQGFAIMSIGGLLVVIYALALQIWVFLVLNAIFFVANVIELRKLEATR